MYATLWLLRDDPVNDEKQDKDKDKCFITNRAPTDTFVYNDDKDFRAIIIEVHISKIYFVLSPPPPPPPGHCVVNCLLNSRAMIKPHLL